MGSLRQIVHDECRLATDPDPVLIARSVIDRLTPTEQRDALEVTMRTFITQMMTSGRARSLSEACPAPGVGRSKWDGIAKVLRQPISTADGWKFLADCTRDDVLTAATQRRTEATALEASASWFESLADVMRRRKVATVGELGEDIPPMPEVQA